MGDVQCVGGLKQTDPGRFQCVQPDGKVIEIRADAQPPVGQLPSVVVNQCDPEGMDTYACTTADGERAEVRTGIDPTTKQKVIFSANVQGKDGQWRRFETRAGAVARAAAQFEAAKLGDRTAPANGAPADLQFAPGEEALAAGRGVAKLREAGARRRVEIDGILGTTTTTLAQASKQRDRFVITQNGNTITVSQRMGNGQLDQPLVSLTKDGRFLHVKTFEGGKAKEVVLSDESAARLWLAAKRLDGGAPAAAKAPVGDTRREDGLQRLDTLRTQWTEAMRVTERLYAKQPQPTDFVNAVLRAIEPQPRGSAEFDYCRRVIQMSVQQLKSTGKINRDQILNTMTGEFMRANMKNT